MKKMLNSQLIGAYERWAEFAKEAKEMRVKLKRAAGKIMNRQLSQAFNRWDEATQEAKELRIKLRRYLLRMQKKGLSDAFTIWWEEVDYAKKLREEQRFMQEINGMKQKQLEKFMQKMMNAQLQKVGPGGFYTILAASIPPTSSEAYSLKSTRV